MQPELITALAALGGAAVGGLTTVWATHRTNRAAADRERAQRLHDERQRSYTQAQEAAAELLTRYYAARLMFASGSVERVSEEALNLRGAASRVKVLLPQLQREVEQVVQGIRSESPSDEPFLSKALIELDKLRPE